MLGKVKKAIVKKEDTTLVDGAGKKKAIKESIALLKRQIEESTSDYDKEKLQERLAKLAGGVGIIRVGAATEIEMKEKKDRVDDAQHATKAAVEEGILPGGGVAFIRCIPVLKTLCASLSGDEKVGVEIIIKATQLPFTPNRRKRRQRRLDHRPKSGSDEELTKDGMLKTTYSAT